MNRRNFIKAITVVVGATAITPAMAKSLPKVIPNDWYIVLHEELPNSIVGEVSYKEYTRLQIPQSIGGWGVGGWGNSEAIYFPTATRNARLSKLSVQTSDGAVICEAPLAYKLDVSQGITPCFAVGDLTIEEN